MTVDEDPNLIYRLLQSEDIGQVPMMCQGGEDAVMTRVADIGSAAVLVFDGEQHVAQLQFRRYDRDLRSPKGLWDPLYWGDFGDTAPHLPANSLAVFCYHVGQLEDSDARDKRYQGRGIGLDMLDYLIDWAVDQAFSAMVAKCTPSPRPVMSFMGGQPAEAYIERGFELQHSWVDSQLWDVIRERQLVDETAIAYEAARVGCCVKRF